VLLIEGLLLQGGSQIRPLPWLDLDRDKASPAPSGVTIMVVDDDERGRRVTARMLRDEGYDVIEARSGEEALEQLAGASAVQVVLTDIAMPGGVDGVELAHRVLAAAPWRQVVLMSGYARLFPQLGTYGARFPLLMKPFSADQLLRQINEVLRGEMN
jgi:two-component system cell cycle sensor histidine kinase/response regulator CckA